MPSKTLWRPFRRLIRNVVRFPRRSFEWMGRALKPDYVLERKAKALTRRLKPDRLAALRAIPGYCLERECCLIAYLALIAPMGAAIVEIGAFKGRTTAWLIEAAQLRPDRAAVHSIDPHVLGSWDDFCATVTKLRLIERGLRVHHDASRTVARTWSAPISLLWIDGSHDYDDVRSDIRDFVQHVVADGLIAFHDTSWKAFPGVMQAITEWESVTLNCKRIATLRMITIFQKIA